MKKVEQPPQQQASYAYPLYPTQEMEYSTQQVPSAPPSYDEAMYHQTPPYAASSTEFKPQPPQPPPAVEVQVQRTIIALPLGPNPARIRCPNCHADVLTKTETEPNCAAHLCCLLLFVVGCCPFSCLPYFMDSLKNVRHSCPNCKVYLGTYQP